MLALTCSVLAACAQAPDEVEARQVFARAQTTQNIEERVRVWALREIGEAGSAGSGYDEGL